MKENLDATVIIGDGVVTIKRNGKSGTTIANILGVVQHEKSQSIYLDRLVHENHEQALGKYSVTGAISSILTA